MRKAPLIFLAIFLNSFILSAQGWQWARFTGNTNSDRCNAVARDSAGNCYATGNFYTKVTFGGTDYYDFTGKIAYYLVKYDRNGNVIWVAQAQGASGTAIAVDKTGNIYTAGYLSSPNKFGSTVITNCGIFIAKHDKNGVLQWAKGVTSTGGITHVSGMRFDGLGCLFLIGRFASSLTVGGTTLNAGGTNYDAFIARFDKNANGLWVKKAGGVDNDRAYGLVVDSIGNSYMAGTYAGSITYGTKTLNGGSNAYNMFLAKYDPFGNILWVRTGYGAGAATMLYTLAADKHCRNIYAPIEFSGNSFNYDTLIGTTYTGTNGYTLLTKYSSNGVPSLPTQIKLYGEVRSADRDSLGNVYYTGYAIGATTIGSFVLPNNSSDEMLVFKTDSMHTAQWAQFSSAATLDENYGLSICHDGTGGAYVGGYYSKASTIGNTPMAFSGVDDLFVARFSYLTGEEEKERTKNNFIVFPNPSGGNLFIKLPSSFSGEATLEVLNVLGEKIAQFSVSAGEADFFLSSGGIYFCRLISSSGELLGTEKVVIE